MNEITEEQLRKCFKTHWTAGNVARSNLDILTKCQCMAVIKLMPGN